MKKVIFILLLSFLTVNCSLYKSNLRKTFETDSTGRVRPASFKACSNIGSLQAWLETDYSNENRELLISDNNIEAWKTQKADGQIQVTSIYHQNSDNTACTWNFTSQEQWQSEKTATMNDIMNGPEVTTNETTL